MDGTNSPAIASCVHIFLTEADNMNIFIVVIEFVSWFLDRGATILALCLIEKLRPVPWKKPAAMGLYS